MSPVEMNVAFLLAKFGTVRVIGTARSKKPTDTSTATPSTNGISTKACALRLTMRPGIAATTNRASFDAEQKFGIGYGAASRFVKEPEGCRCGDVMTGRIKPPQCPKFGAECLPETPLGALMVSSEGACAAYYQYGGSRLEAAE